MVWQRIGIQKVLQVRQVQLDTHLPEAFIAPLGENISPELEADMPEQLAFRAHDAIQEPPSGTTIRRSCGNFCVTPAFGQRTAGGANLADDMPEQLSFSELSRAFLSFPEPRRAACASSHRRQSSFFVAPGL